MWWVGLWEALVVVSQKWSSPTALHSSRICQSGEKRGSELEVREKGGQAFYHGRAHFNRIRKPTSQKFPAAFPSAL